MGGSLRSTWLELAWEGEVGDVTPLAFVADDERCRERTPVGLDVVAAAARVAMDGVEGESTRTACRRERERLTA